MKKLFTHTRSCFPACIAHSQNLGIDTSAPGNTAMPEAAAKDFYCPCFLHLSILTLPVRQTGYPGTTELSVGFTSPGRYLAQCDQQRL